MPLLRSPWRSCDLGSPCLYAQSWSKATRPNAGRNSFHRLSAAVLLNSLYSVVQCSVCSCDVRSTPATLVISDLHIKFGGLGSDLTVLRSHHRNEILVEFVQNQKSVGESEGETEGACKPGYNSSSSIARWGLNMIFGASVVRVRAIRSR
jgi:hypothetical protein